MKPFKAACLQVNASNVMAENIEAASLLAVEARAAGAELILMPENVAMMEWGRGNIVLKAMPEEDHLALKAFRDLARELGCWMHIGSLACLLDGGMVANRGFVLRPDGVIAARYDKIHMFDADLGLGETYRESATFQAGGQAVTADLPWGKLGLSICYDLRFPHLYRALAKADAAFLAVPAAFTKTTGQAHWHVLLRARAIETGCYVFAPAQVGTPRQRPRDLWPRIDRLALGRGVGRRDGTARLGDRRNRPGAGHRGAPQTTLPRPRPPIRGARTGVRRKSRWTR